MKRSLNEPNTYGKKNQSHVMPVALDCFGDLRTKKDAGFAGNAIPLLLIRA